MNSSSLREVVSQMRGSIVVFDLEYTAWPGSLRGKWSKPGEHREVVAIGAVKLSARTGLPEIDQLSCLVKPRINPQLSDYFIDLTGLTQELVERNGVPFKEALDRFMAFVGGDVEAAFSNGCDEEVIAENCQLEAIEFSLPSKLFRNARPILAAAAGLKLDEVDSYRLTELFGLQNAHRAHDALDDARAVAGALRKIANS